MNNRLALVMVNHNGGEEVRASVRSVLDQLTELDRLVLVDNGTYDGSGVSVRNEHPEIQFFSNEANLTYSAANNIGLRWALDEGFEFIGLINPDVRLHPGMIESLISLFHKKTNDHRIGAVSPVMILPGAHERIWFAGGKIHWLFSWISNKGSGKKLEEAKQYTGYCEYLTGCCWVSPATVWRDVGLLDDSYAMYTEDVDWSWRARRSNYKLWVEDSAVLLHNLSQSSGGGRSPFKMHYRTLTNRLFFYRYTPFYLRPLQKIIGTFVNILYFIFLIFQGNIPAAKSFIKAAFQPIENPVKWLTEKN
ncbi:glycosyltransferase family 2 protein [bacterium]|nr:glycosyltransferase family 2 protein [bacterium]